MVLTRARGEEGFGLLELLMSMVVLNVGMLAIVAAVSSGTLAVRQAGRQSTAAAIADVQMERYRALRYTSIFLDTTEAGNADADATYRDDVGRSYPNAMVTATCSGSPPADNHLPYECDATRVLTGPDGQQYRIDTYIHLEQPQPTASTRQLKRVTVVVRHASDLSRVLARQVSTFDLLSG
jgi:Tfp pilus assembly protein PilV